MATKITKREVINMMLEDENIKGIDTYVNYLEHELELLDKKVAGRKPKKEDERNIELCGILMEVFESGFKGTVSEVQAKHPDLKALSNQKATSLIRSLVEKGEVVKTTEKGKSIFSIA